MRPLSRSTATLLAGLFVALLISPAVFAAAPQAESEADDLFQAEKWQQAAQAYEAIVKNQPANGAAWYRLGYAQYKLKRYTPAISAFEQAKKNGFAPGRASYNAASCYALLNEKEKAFESLKQAAANGFADFKTLQTDPDIASLRDDARFPEIVEQVKHTARPCENLPVYRQFDFWVGEWDVSIPSGRKVGTNTIQKIAGGCALLENWSSLSGVSVGKSINYYDPAKKKWVQTWADSSGEIIPTEGELKDGAMRLEGELIGRGGKKSLYRGTWTPLDDGRVHQFLEESKDGGKTWNTWFDGYYKRRASSTP